MQLFSLFQKKPPRICFDHLPKCGGTGLTGFLNQFYRKDQRYRISGQHAGQSVSTFLSLPQKERYRYRFINGHLARSLLPAIHPDTRVFTVLREPVDRVISHYYYAKSEPKHYLYERLNAEKISLVAYVSGGMCHEAENWYAQHLTGLSRDEIREDPDQALEKSVKALFGDYAYVGRLDNLDAFMVMLCGELGLPSPVAHNGKVNRNRTRPDRDAIPEADKAVIISHNQVDIRIYEALMDS